MERTLRPGHDHWLPGIIRFQLLINPLAGAISAGNCVALKPSELTPGIAGVMEEMIAEFFEPRYISLFNGPMELSQVLIRQKWDLIFFTGSPAVGRIVMESAAGNLCPVVLELGGKSPCIVDADANLKVAASRIVWGKFLNAGQTCIAPDYLFAHASVKAELLNLMSKKITQYFGNDPEKVRISTYCERNKNLEARRVSGKAMLWPEVKSIYRVALFRQPYLIISVRQTHNAGRDFWSDTAVMEFSTMSEVTDFINSNPKPLALYYFSEDKSKQVELLSKTSSGGVCINDVITHIANPNLPFGESGIQAWGNTMEV